MKPDDPLKLVGEVRDLQIVDSESSHCGIADDIECKRQPRGELVINALLVGPGAFEYRLPKWAYAAIKGLFGDHVVRIPWSEIEHVTSQITLKKPAATYGLLKSELRWAAMVKKVPCA